MKSRARWREKLEKRQEPRLVDVPRKMSRFGKGTILTPTPLLVDGLIRKVPKGKLITVSELRRKLAVDFDAVVTCPLTTVFVRIAAEPAKEDRANGRQGVTLYSRVIRDDGSLNPKLPGAGEQQTRQLRAEGFIFIRKGKKPPAVKHFERGLYVVK